MQIRKSRRSFRGEIRSLVSLLICLFLAAQIGNAQSRRFTNGNRLSLQPNIPVRVENPGGNIMVNFTQRADLELIVKRHNPSGPVVSSDEYQIEQNTGQLRIVANPIKESGGVDMRLSLPEGTALRLFSSTGDIEINGSAGNLLAKSESGNIRLGLPERMNADVALSTFNGAVRSTRSLKTNSESDSRAIHGQLGEGGILLSAYTRSGQILLMSAGDQSPAFAQSTEETDKEELIVNDPIKNDKRVSDYPRIPPRRDPRNVERTTGRTSIDKGTEVNDENVLKIESQLVTLNASVSTLNGKPVLDLQKEDFNLFEDRVKQEIVHFQSVKTPFNLVLLIDLSGSVRDKIKLIKKAANRFVQAIRPEDKVGIITFSNSARIVSQLTNDRELLRHRIDDIRKPDGGTSFYDALYDTLNYMLRTVRGQRNAVVIMSDGVDNALPGVPGEGSEVSFDEVFERVQESDITIFPIYLDTEKEAIDNFGMRMAEAYDTARQQLGDLAEQTGGAMFSVNRLEDLEGRYEQVAAELRTIYSLGYYPANNSKDGSFHRIQVQVNRSDARVRTRRGYFSKKKG
jgi:VWFA-related protein